MSKRAYPVAAANEHVSPPSAYHYPAGVRPCSSRVAAHRLCLPSRDGSFRPATEDCFSGDDARGRGATEPACGAQCQHRRICLLRPASGRPGSDLTPVTEEDYQFGVQKKTGAHSDRHEKGHSLSSRSRWAQLANWGAPRSSSETPRGGLDHSGLALVNAAIAAAARVRIYHSGRDGAKHQMRPVQDCRGGLLAGRSWAHRVRDGSRHRRFCAEHVAQFALAVPTSPQH